MYICVCNPVTDSEIRGCVRRGACTLSDLQMQLGIASQCGMCAPAAVAIIEELTVASVPFGTPRGVSSVAAAVA